MTKEQDSSERTETMPKPTYRSLLYALVDAYDRLSKQSPDMRYFYLHEIEDWLCKAIVESGYRAVMKNGNIYLPDPNGAPGEVIFVVPAEAEDLDGSGILHCDKNP